MSVQLSTCIHTNTGHLGRGGRIAAGLASVVLLVIAAVILYFICTQHFSDSGFVLRFLGAYGSAAGGIILTGWAIVSVCYGPKSEIDSLRVVKISQAEAERSKKDLEMANQTL